MKILITGGYGFIGSQLTRLLLDAGDKVVIYDALKHFAKKGNYEEALKLREPLVRGANIIIGDIRDDKFFTEVLDKEKPSIVVHLAAIPLYSPRKTYEDSFEDINLLGTIRVIEACAKNESVKRLIIASSSMAYGDFDKQPQDENKMLFPLDRYGVTKACNEVYLKEIMCKANKEWIVVRPSAVYGPRDCNNRVVQIFVEAGLRGNVEIRATEDEKLDFTYIKDIADGYFLLTRTDKVNEIYNMTTGQGRKVTDLAELVKKYFPQLEIILQPRQPNNSIRGELDITKAKKLVGYKPKYTLETGLKEYIEFELARRK